MPVLAAVQSLLTELTAGGGADGLSASVVGMAELVASISELLAVCVYQHLPLPSLAGSPETGSGSHTPATGLSSATPSLSDQEVYLSPETLSFLSSVLLLLPHQATLWFNTHQAQRRIQRQEQSNHHHQPTPSTLDNPTSSPLAAPSPAPPAAYITALLDLCLHVARHGDAALSALAATAVQGLVVACTVGWRGYQVSLVGVVSALVGEVGRYVGGGGGGAGGDSVLSVHSDHRVVALLRVLWTLASSIGCAGAAGGGVEDLMSASSGPAINVPVLRQVAAVFNSALTAERYRSLTLLVLIDVVFLNDPSPAASILRPTTQPAASYLFALLAPTLLTLLHHLPSTPPTTTTPTTTATPSTTELLVRAVQKGSADLSTPELASFLPVALPVLIAALGADGAGLGAVMLLAAQSGALFRHCVALLPAELRAKLQAAAMAAQGGDLPVIPSSEAAVEDTSVGKSGKAKKEKEKLKKKRSENGSGTLHAEDAISLSMDFSSFARKK